MIADGLPERAHSPEILALKEVRHAKKLLEAALHEWWAPETFDRVHDAAETLRTAAWRLRNDDAA